MTKKMHRSIRPYTLNLAFSGLGQFEDRVEKVLHEYFSDEDAWPVISERLYQAVNNYYLEVQTNPDRKITRLQRTDQHEMIECMKELSIRMHPVLYIPLPLLNKARTDYVQFDGLEKTLDEEIKAILARLRNLRTIFESIEIPVPTKTNPGKPEQARLLRTIAQLFDDAALDDDSYRNTPPADVLRERREFVQRVCEAFHLQITLPRKL
jgi:hypothetical protein